MKIYFINLLVILFYNVQSASKFFHHDNIQLVEYLDKVHKQCPEITTRFELEPETVNGNKINGIIFGIKSDVHTPLIPEFRYLGNIHGNEVTGREMILTLADFLCKEYLQGNYNITQLIKLTRIHLVPSINLDGWENATQATEKDRNNLQGRVNANNYDLNRNFPRLNSIFYQFAKEDPTINHHLMDYYNELNNTDVLQPETKAIMNYIMSEPFVLSGSLHGGVMVVSYGFDESENHPLAAYSATPDDALFRVLGKEFVKDLINNGYAEMPYKDTIWMPLEVFNGGIINGAQWYSLSGGLQDFSYLATNCFELTFELSCTKYPKNEYIGSIWEEEKNALINFIWKTHLGVKGIIYDSKTGEPIFDGIVHVEHFENDEFVPIWHDITSNKDGDYYRLLLPGKYKITIFKKGYKSTSTIIKVKNEIGKEAKKIDFELLPI